MNGKIILCKGIKLDKEYTNVLSYTENQMLALCNDNSHKIAEASDYTFIDRNRKIRVGFSYALCTQANYIAFQNPDYSNKWFFAFIESIEFKGNANTEITFKIDSWSTWFDYWTKKTCLITRQHVNDDTIGLHTVPENLEVTEVIQEDYEEDSSYTSEFGYYVVIASGWKPNDNSHGKAVPADGKNFNTITVYNKQVFGNELFLFPITQLSDFINPGLFIQRTNSDGHVADIKDMFIVPNALIKVADLNNHTAYATSNNDFPFDFYTLSRSIDIENFTTTITKLTSFTGITVKNNKCFCYPYNYLYVTNNNGNDNIYKYENFSTNDCKFDNQLSIGIGCSGRLVPKNYKGMTTCDDESIPLGKYPTCGWSADSYTNWLSQQAVNFPTKLASSFMPSISPNKETGGTSVDVASTVVNVASETANQIGAFYSASLLPNIQSGGNNGNVMFGADKICFTFRKMRVKNEYMKRIDDYFTRFGYKLNELTLPNITGRTYWNYVEIAPSEEIGYGDVPTNFMTEINNACRRGTTIWHNHANVGNYSLTNAIVT